MTDCTDVISCHVLNAVSSHRHWAKPAPLTHICPFTTKVMQSHLMAKIGTRSNLMTQALGAGLLNFWKIAFRTRVMAVWMDWQKVPQKPQFWDQFDVCPLWTAITWTLEVQLTWILFSWQDHFITVSLFWFSLFLLPLSGFWPFSFN